jgi:micrococcal nuclease
VVSVTDGDTLRVRAGGREVRVRLLGIDTPETRRPGAAVECGGKNATASMKRLVFVGGRGRRVTLSGDPTQP